MKTVVYLARHGETKWTVEDRFAGHSDVELADSGRVQAKDLAIRLGRERVAATYSSPLRRCLETAAIVCAQYGQEPRVVDDLMELDYGLWDGMQRQEIVEQYPAEWAVWTRDPASSAPPEGETGYAALARAAAALQQIVARHRGQVVLVVAHKAINRLLLCGALGAPPRDYRRRIAQAACALNCVEWHDGEPLVSLLNETRHLRNSGE